MDTEHSVSGTVFYTFVSTLLRRTTMDTGFERGTRTIFMNFFLSMAAQKGLIGITLVCHWMVPLYDTELDHHAAQRAIDFMFMEPLTTGEYPSSMRSLVGSRLPKFSIHQSNLVRGSFDFIGLNYYTANYATDAPQLRDANPSFMTDFLVNLTTKRNGKPIGPKAFSNWLFVYPQGILELLLYTKAKYNNPMIYITENGIDEFNDPTLSLDEALNDTNRIDYYFSHLYNIQTAIKDGVNVKGYFAWSLIDNFEWIKGYTSRYIIRFPIIYN
ncbi:hypothetical protein Ahy_A05g023637 isoform F [Arachis hypogaea]|uniref:Beta-glucosidase n=1 Tax=Arachis hypogaea TaxID=3818 RepID=A0A445D416_ARAHY|nr:hypothetical protein Ahy_A05g023637 isoform F [Arachis hypogaea]